MMNIFGGHYDSRHNGSTTSKKPRKRLDLIAKRRINVLSLMWIKRIGIGIMVLLLLGQAYRLVAVYQEKQHIEQQLQELKQRNEELEQEKG